MSKRMGSQDRRRLPDHFPYEDEHAGCRGILNALVIVAVLVTVAFCVTGCSTAKPYLELGVGHDFQAMNFRTNVDGRVGERYSLACGTGTAEVGVEWPSGWSVAYRHQSCVEPDRYAEKEVDEIAIRKKWGGVK